MMHRKLIPLLVLSACSLLSGGCATYKSISAAQTGSPKILSGTRLNLTALNGNEYAMMKFRVGPPAYPLLDLPVSFIADMSVLPLTIPVAIYEWVFE